jgi:hypothetical protein
VEAGEVRMDFARSVIWPAALWGWLEDPLMLDVIKAIRARAEQPPEDGPALATANAGLYLTVKRVSRRCSSRGLEVFPREGGRWMC